jgi:hypothetical protein
MRKWKGKGLKLAHEAKAKEEAKVERREEEEAKARARAEAESKRKEETSGTKQVEGGSSNLEVPTEPTMQSITQGQFPLHEMGLGHFTPSKSESVMSIGFSLGGWEE